MPAKEGKTTNFKTYEAQMRLMAAIVASMPQPWKFDYKSESSSLYHTTSSHFEVSVTSGCPPTPTPLAELT
jgi:hypothetical protein